MSAPAKRNEQRRKQRELARSRPYDPAAAWHGTASGYTNHCCRCEPCRDAYRAYSNEWRKRPEVAERIRANARAAAKRPHNILRKKATQYGLEPELLAVYLEDGICFACGDHVPGELAVDHDHRCCKSFRKVCGDCVRGLLCRRCNTALGLVADSPERLRALLAYLERWEAKRAESATA